jgi:hypothetical protein
MLWRCHPSAAPLPRHLHLHLPRRVAYSSHLRQGKSCGLLHRSGVFLRPAGRRDRPRRRVLPAPAEQGRRLSFRVAPGLNRDPQALSWPNGRWPSACRSKSFRTFRTDTQGFVEKVGEICTAGRPLPVLPVSPPKRGAGMDYANFAKRSQSKRANRAVRAHRSVGAGRPCGMD